MLKISKKISLSYSFLIVVLIGALLFIFLDLVKKTQINIIRQEMKEKINFIELVFRESPYLKKSVLGLKKETDAIAKIINLRITIVNLDGVVLADSDMADVSSLESHRYRDEVMDSLEKGSGERIRYSRSLKTDFMYMSKKSDSFIIRLAKPIPELNRSIKDIGKVILFLGGLALVSSLLIIIYISNKITKPVNETVNFARQFSGGDFSRRIMFYSDDEIGYLQRSLNGLADTVADKINSLMFEQKKIQVTLENISDGIAVIGNNRKIIVANRAFSSFFGIEKEASGRVYFDVIRSSACNTKIELALESGKPVSFEDRLLNGKYCDISINPIQEEKTMQGILLVLHDISEKKRIGQIKKDLVANLSHELKTPVAIIKGYLETIKENLADPAAAADMIGKAIRNADRQNAIINDILKLDMIESTNGFPDEDINIARLIEYCVEILKPRAAEKKIECIQDLAPADFSVRAARFLAEEVFFNIIDNAINYNSSPGKIYITAEKKDARIKISIKDTGIGIPEDSLERVFERFYRVDRSRSRSTGGTGLGLSIVRHAASILGWQIKVVSGKEGSTFSVDI